MADTPVQMLSEWIQGQKVKGPSMKTASSFYRNLEEAMDARRAAHRLVILQSREGTIDFSSNDVLSLSTSGLLRGAFLEELAKYPDFWLGSRGSRLLGGNGTYITDLEREIAAFHGAAKALVVNSGYDGNIAIFGAIPRPGDVIVFDELVHASVHDGLKHSPTQTQIQFRHNDVDSFREVLLQVKNSHPLIRSGARCVLIAVESVYSMDGDVCPLEKLVHEAKDIFPSGNAQFIIDEAHSTGVLGDRGQGLVCALGLESQIAIRLHTYGKALATTGAAILGNDTVRNTLLNFSRSIIYTTAPSFPVLASIRAGYKLMQDGLTRQPRDQLLRHVEYFFNAITSNPIWNDVVEADICSIPLGEDWHSKQFITQFVPLWTRPKYNYYLVYHLQLVNICAFPIDPPVVPLGTSRVRLVIHADNTKAEIQKLADSICEWAKEMLDIEQDMDAHHSRVPSAAREVYDLMATFGVHAPNQFVASLNPFVMD